jgi:hypothetical protein
MAWVLSIVLGYLPDLWIMAAIAGAVLWLYAWMAPDRLAAEVARMTSLAALGGALYLWTFATATAAAEARYQAAMEAERARQAEIVARSVEDARRAATAADEARRQAESRLDTVLAGIPPDPPPPPKGYGGGLSPASAKSIISMRGAR